MAAYTTIDNPELYFQSKIWSGNNSGSGISITLDGDENMQPDLVWVKSRDATHAHVLYDSVRTSPAKYLLQPNTNVAERTAAIGSFDSDGVTFSDSDGFYNGSDTYVGWFWKESADAGLDIVSFAGNDTARTISHSLSAVPNMMILKDRDAANDWFVYHSGNTSAPETDYFKLNSTAATADLNTLWNDTSPTTSVFTIGTNGNINTTGNDYIAFLFANKQGFSKFGKYTGNGSATDGTFVYTGFRPAFLVVKQSSADGEGWYMWDNKRSSSGGANENNRYLIGSANSAEGALGVDCDFLSNGFKHYYGADASNDASDTYVYMAFAEAPFVNSNGVPCNAK